MEGCLNVEDLDSVRLAHESDNEWRIRRMFLERHCGDYQRTRLLCLSQIFINITFLGCKYSDGLMAKVREMGAGICEKVNDHRKNFDNGCTKDSGGRIDTMGPPNKLPKRAAETSESIKAKNFMLLKAETSLMENRVDALQSLNRAASRVKVAWELKEVSANGEIALSVDDVVILKFVFPGGKTPAVKQYAAAATLAAISSDNVEIRNVSGNLELWRGNVGPRECYSDYITAKLHKAAALLPKGGSAYARLEKALQSANIPLQFIAEQGTGWEERIALQVLNVELASAVLRKSECAKGRELQRKEELAASVISSISSPLLKLVASDKGLTIAN